MKIYSGLAVIDAESKKELLDCEVARVKMSKLSNKEIDDYIKTGEPLDKAGAFAVQRHRRCVYRKNIRLLFKRDRTAAAQFV